MALQPQLILAFYGNGTFSLIFHDTNCPVALRYYRMRSRTTCLILNSNLWLERTCSRCAQKTLSHFCLMKQKFCTCTKCFVFYIPWSKIFLFSVGDHKKGETENSEEDHNVLRVIIHPNYDPDILTNDIALLDLDTPIQFDNDTFHVFPVCLTRSDPPVG